jgi:hypothetical protein
MGKFWGHFKRAWRFLEIAHTGLWFLGVFGITGIVTVALSAISAIIKLHFGLIAILCVFFGSFSVLGLHRFIVRRRSQTHRIGELAYDFNPGNPEELPNGWHYNYKNDGVRVEFRLPVDPPSPRSIEIVPTGVYAIFRPVQPSYSLAKRLRFSCLFSSTDSTVYVWFRCSHRDGRTKEVRIAYRAGKGSPSPWKDGTSEWVVLVKGTSIANGWREFDILIPLDVERTFGVAGFSFDMLTKLSLRGHICISPITLFES